ncbi:hypothetical protein KIL84_014063 [Mauremys mutica]|uniref:Uncharacterized protein n=1 Tax=Mauremys mutica TaxID=74926 RepID=A0A9D3WZ35_9SAUR|nr:hypothetical protein KIL84_014063 [Mauremys mutica]
MGLQNLEDPPPQCRMNLRTMSQDNRSYPGCFGQTDGEQSLRDISGPLGGFRELFSYRQTTLQSSKSLAKWTQAPKANKIATAQSLSTSGYPLLLGRPLRLSELVPGQTFASPGIWEQRGQLFWTQ